MWNKRPDKRLRYWYEFRLSLEDLTRDEFLKETAAFWATAPFVEQFLAPDLPKSWPSPWELIHDNYYDSIGLGLGMFYTVVLSKKFLKDNIYFSVYSNYNRSQEYYLVITNNGVLNLRQGRVVDLKKIDKDMNLKFQYEASDLGVCRY